MPSVASTSTERLARGAEPVGRAGGCTGHLCDDVTVRRAGWGWILIVALVACADDGRASPAATKVRAPTVVDAGPSDATDTTGPAAVATTSTSTTVATVAPTTTVTTTTEAPDVLEPALREELLAMMAEDQAEMMGEVATDNYRARTERLAEILGDYGWPGFDLVGEDGSLAAWVIAQHADLDLDVQRRALELLREAAERDQASRGDLAYLHDRVAVASGESQLYGTQIRCGEDQLPVPATPIADEASVAERRAEAGLPPLEEYVAEMTAICAGDFG